MIFRYILTPMILAELNYDSCRLIQDLYPDLGVNLVLFFQTIPRGFDVHTLLNGRYCEHELPPTCRGYILHSMLPCMVLLKTNIENLNLKPTLCTLVKHFGALNVCPSVYIVGFWVCMLFIISLSPIHGFHLINQLSIHE